MSRIFEFRCWVRVERSATDDELLRTAIAVSSSVQWLFEGDQSVVMANYSTRIAEVTPDGLRRIMNPLAPGFADETPA